MTHSCKKSGMTLKSYT